MDKDYELKIIEHMGRPSKHRKMFYLWRTYMTTMGPMDNIISKKIIEYDTKKELKEELRKFKRQYGSTRNPNLFFTEEPSKTAKTINISNI